MGWVIRHVRAGDRVAVVDQESAGAPSPGPAGRAGRAPFQGPRPGRRPHGPDLLHLPGPWRVGRAVRGAMPRRGTSTRPRRLRILGRDRVIPQLGRSWHGRTGNEEPHACAEPAATTPPRHGRRSTLSWPPPRPPSPQHAHHPGCQLANRHGGHLHQPPARLPTRLCNAARPPKSGQATKDRELAIPGQGHRAPGGNPP